MLRTDFPRHGELPSLRSDIEIDVILITIRVCLTYRSPNDRLPSALLTSSRFISYNCLTGIWIKAPFSPSNTNSNCNWMQSRLLFSIVGEQYSGAYAFQLLICGASVVLVFVAACVLCTVALRRTIWRRSNRSPEIPYAQAFDRPVITQYGHLVRTTLNWLDGHRVPINGFARTFIDTLFPADIDHHAPYAAEEQSNRQSLGQLVPFSLQRPPPAYH